MEAKDERIRELTRSLMRKGQLVDELNERLVELQRSTVEESSMSTSQEELTPSLHAKTLLIAKLSHGLKTAVSVLRSERDAHSYVKAALRDFECGLVSDMSSSMEVLVRHDEERRRLAEEVRSLRDELNGLKDEVKRVEGERRTLSSKLQALETARDSESSSNGVLKEQLVSLAADLESANAELDSKTAAHSLLSSEHDDLKGAFQLISSTHASLETEFATLQSSTDAQVHSLTMEVNSGNEKISELKLAEKAVRDELILHRSSARTAAENREREMMVLQQRLDAANKKISDLNELLSTKVAGDRTIELTAEIDDLRSSMDGLTAENAQLKASLSSATKSLDVTRSDLSDERATTLNINAEVNLLRAELQKERDTNAKRGSAIRNLELEVDEAKGEAAKAALVSKSLETEVASLNSKLNETLASHSSTVDSLHDQVRLLEQSLVNMTDVRDNIKVELDAVNLKLSQVVNASPAAIQSLESELVQLRTTLASKDDEITRLQATVHRECMERTAILEKLKALQAIPPGTRITNAQPASPLVPTTPPKNLNESSPDKKWITGRGRGSGSARGRRKSGLLN